MDLDLPGIRLYKTATGLISCNVTVAGNYVRYAETGILVSYQAGGTAGSIDVRRNSIQDASVEAIRVESTSPNVVKHVNVSLIGTIVAAVAGLGESARCGIERVRRRLAEKDAETQEAHAEAEDAMKALDEIKKAHPEAVKKATSRKKRPRLRHAYVRREAQAQVET